MPDRATSNRNGNGLPLKMHRKKIFLLSTFLLNVLLSDWAGGSNMHYLGSEYKANYVWGLAMNLVWNELNEIILQKNLKLRLHPD